MTTGWRRRETARKRWIKGKVNKEQAGKRVGPAARRGSGAGRGIR
jgi:hypothetical protein